MKQKNCFWAIAATMLLTATSFTSCSNQDNIIGPVQPDQPYEFDEGSLIKNGTCEGNNVENFKVQVGNGAVEPAVLKWDKITPKNHCVLLEVGEDATKFFITFEKNPLKANDVVKVSMKVMANEECTATTEIQGAPGETLNTTGIGEIAFGTDWAEVSGTASIGEEEGAYTIAFNLPANKTVYFDDIKVTVSEPEQPADIAGFDLLFWNYGVADETIFSTKYFKNYTAKATAEKGAIVVESLDPDQVYTEYDNDGAEAKVSVDWDTQFLISLPKSLAAGTKVKLSLKVKADKATTADVQAHTAIPAPGAIEGKDGYAGTYIHYDLLQLGWGNNFNFTTEWTTFEKEFTIPAEADGMQSICFNLEKLRELNKYYFDDIKVYVEKEAEPAAEAGWKNLFWSKPVYLSSFSTKYFKNYTATKSSDGAIVVESLDPEQVYDKYYNAGGEAKVANNHDVQFLISLPETLAAGTKVKLTMDIKADKAASAETQAHTAIPAPGAIEGKNNYGGTYMHWSLLGEIPFTTEWATFDKEFEVPSEANGMQSICLNLEKLREANKYYFKNIVVRVAE